jgi:Zn-dependent peptidase ImmA (M78 family)
LDGLYLWCCNHNIILLDNSLPIKRQLHRCVLAEEMGHYYTAARSNLLIMHPSYNYNDSLRLSKDEYRAMCWATDYLIPDAELIKATQELGLRSCYELAEYFDVIQSFMMYKLAILKQCFRRGGLKVKARSLFEMELAPCNF